MFQQNASYLVKHIRNTGKNLNKICLKIVEKALKQPLQNVNFQKFAGGGGGGGGHVSEPLKPFLYLLQSNSAEKQKRKTFEKM